MWDVMTGQKVRDYHEDRAWGAAFTPDGKRIAIGRNDRVNVLDVVTGKPVHDFGGHNGTVWRVRFTPDGRLLTYGGEAVIEWDPRTGRKLGERKYNGSSYLDTSRDGKRIVTTGTDQKLRLWSPGQLNELHVVAPDREPLFSVQLHPDGKEFVVGGGKPGIQVFDAGTGRLRRTIAVGETTYLTQFSQDGRWLVFQRTGDHATLVVWDWAADKQLLTLDFGEQSLCAQKAFSTDGRLMAVGNSEGHIRVFDLRTGKPTHEVNMNGCADERAYLSNRVYDLSFSPDGRLLATGAADGVVRVWELATGSERFRLAGHRGGVWALAYSPDGARLASGSDDRSVVTWDATGAGMPIDPKHQPKDAADAWVRLADRDAAAGFAAVRYLSARPVDAVALAKGVRPVPAADPKVVAGLVEKLGSEDFVTREQSEKELVALGEGAADALRAELARATDAESRQRLTKLLAPLGGPPRAGPRLQAVRAVEVLERVGTADARAALRAWAGGARGAELTEAAGAALARLEAGGATPRGQNESKR
ncbi:WD40 repeat domain-containing protein [Gemmata sp. JC673]|uniref:WD40 repeat domain-containing protein n=1 Tax=Gemmata algarum TaxID=2975278 RepID=A0ABU5F1Z1_9BACT|nr:WD40 repeat domain-containing protein [Gemmata algarum]MDY3561603.1 WD40 repeat domain-containing protein [Gemmata algarum]